jgi:N-acetylglucosaminyldiphosphoundecaprenol N-acetyl-beta-D-mannosaminyltransferase
VKKNLKREILDIKITDLNIKEVTKEIEFALKNKMQIRIVTLNTFGLSLTLKNKEFKEIINKAELVTPDGFGILWLAKFLSSSLKERVTGIDLIYKICEIASKNSYSVFLLGARPKLAKKASEFLKKKFPQLVISGTCDGYFKEDENKKVVQVIKEKKTDILFVALGVPKQEIWLSENLKKTGVYLGMGVGGSFDVLSGKVKRAPRWIQNAGLEWLYRTIQNPKKINRFLFLPKLILFVLKEKVKTWVNG